MDGHILVYVLIKDANLSVEHGNIALKTPPYYYTDIHDRYLLLPAITMNGIIYSDIKKGGYNGEEFLEWLTGLLPHMNPYPAPNSVLILDNCRIHHVPGVEELCEERYVQFMLFHSSFLTFVQWYQTRLSTALLSRLEPNRGVFLLCESIYSTSWIGVP